MPRSRGSYGRTGSTLIPTGWSAHNMRAASRRATATCQIRLPGTRGPFDPATNTYTTVQGALLFDGGCRVQRESRETVIPVAQQELTTTGYLVTIFDLNAPIVIGALVTFQVATDPLLLSKVLSVVNVLAGSMPIQRDLYALDNQG